MPPFLGVSFDFDLLWPLLPKRLFNRQTRQLVTVIANQQFPVIDRESSAMSFPDLLDPNAHLRHRVSRPLAGLPNPIERSFRPVPELAALSWDRAFRVQAPHYHVALSPPVVVPLAVEDASALCVPRTLESRAHRALQLREEDQVLRPVVQPRSTGAEVRFRPSAAGLGGEDALAVLEG